MADQELPPYPLQHPGGNLIFRTSLLVGAPHYDPDGTAPFDADGAVYVYVVDRTDDPVDPLDDFAFDSNSATLLCQKDASDLSLSNGAHLGYSVSEAGSVLQMGGLVDEEIIVGAPFHDPFHEHFSGGFTNGGYAAILDFQQGVHAELAPPCIQDYGSLQKICNIR